MHDQSWTIRNKNKKGCLKKLNRSSWSTDRSRTEHPACKPNLYIQSRRIIIIIKAPPGRLRKKRSPSPRLWRIDPPRMAVPNKRRRRSRLPSDAMVSHYPADARTWHQPGGKTSPIYRLVAARPYCHGFHQSRLGGPPRATSLMARLACGNFDGRECTWIAIDSDSQSLLHPRFSFNNVIGQRESVTDLAQM